MLGKFTPTAFVHTLAATLGLPLFIASLVLNWSGLEQDGFACLCVATVLFTGVLVTQPE